MARTKVSVPVMPVMCQLTERNGTLPTNTGLDQGWAWEEAETVETGPHSLLVSAFSMGEASAPTRS